MWLLNEIYRELKKYQKLKVKSKQRYNEIYCGNWIGYKLKITLRKPTF